MSEFELGHRKDILEALAGQNTGPLSGLGIRVPTEHELLMRSGISAEAREHLRIYEET